MKTCSSCKIEKPSDDFFRNKDKPDGLQSQCKDCKRIAQNKWYESHKETHVKNTARRKKDVRKWNQDFIIEYLKEHPCVDCGYSNILALQFDHVRGEKHLDVARMISSYCLDTLKIEISKCDVRCANCHQIKTANQFNWYKIIEQ